LFEDDDLIVINKAAGISVHPGAGRKRGTLVNALLSHCKNLSGIGGKERPGIVHRLDKETSGCLAVAKNDFAHREAFPTIRGPHG
jgi:23S rRNA pseudouridine1911/1915/1917 synthase